MSKGERLRAERRAALRSPVTASERPVGVGRPRGAARARVRALGAPQGDAPVSPWQGYGNAITLGRSKVARWKNGRIKREVTQLDSYLAGVRESGIVKTLADVVDVRERDDRDRRLK